MKCKTNKEKGSVETVPDINKIFPYSQMKQVTSDGQSMVYIPKFYICSGIWGSSENNPPSKYQSTNGDCNGKQFWMISATPQEGFHCHPAFMLNGQECTGKEISCYVATQGSDGKPESKANQTNWMNVAFSNCKSTANQRNIGVGEQCGWYAYDIYDHHMLALLMLIEYGNTAIRDKLGTSNMNYRGINDPWGNSHCGNIWIDGIQTSNPGENLSIYDNQGNHNLVSTNALFGGSTNDSGGNGDGYIQEVYSISGNNYNLADIFIPKTIVGQGSDTFSDYFENDSNQPYVLSYNSGDGVVPSNAGPFSLGDSASGSEHFRLARYVS